MKKQALALTVAAVLGLGATTVGGSENPVAADAQVTRILRDAGFCPWPSQMAGRAVGYVVTRISGNRTLGKKVAAK